jgi:hypothetical protein
MQKIVSVVEDYTFSIFLVLIILYYIVRTIYSLYEYRHKNIGKILFKFGHNSSFMIFWGIWIFLFIVIMEIFNRLLNGTTYIQIKNIFLIILFILTVPFLVYFGYKKNRICENGIASFSGCWKWTEIEKYDWKLSLNSNTIKYLCITVPKNIFLFGKNQATLKISPKEYLEHKKRIEDYFINIKQTCA